MFVSLYFYLLTLPNITPLQRTRRVRTVRELTILQPYSLRKKIINELMRTSEWKNKDVAPEMDKVIDAAEELLKIGKFDFKNTNTYVNYEQEIEESSDSPDEEESTQSSESEEDEIRKITSHRRHTKKEKISKTEPKTHNGQPKIQTDKAIDDINQRLDRLTIALERQTKEFGKTSKSPIPNTNQSPRACYMCGKPEVHMIKECPDTIQFMAAGVVKLNDEGRIVRANGTALPRGIPGGGGIAKILKEEIMHKKSTTSNLEIDRNAFLIANYEYAHFDATDTEYEVMPALRSTKTYEEERTQPYKRQEVKDSKKPTLRMKPEVVIQTPKPKPYVEVPVPPRILKRTEELPKKEIPTEDVEMKDEFRPNAGKQKAVDTSTPMSATTQETPTSTGVKPKSKHVEFHEPSEKGNYSGKPKRASPAFKFSSDVQESVDHDRLLDKVLDGPANCTLRDILSTFEMSKRMQVITKTQKIPLETNTGNPKRTSSATIEEIEDDDIPPTVYVRATTAQPPKNAKFPKLVISNAEVDSDDEEAGLSFKERAENFFQRQLEEEFRRECGMESAREFTSENTIQQAPTYLAMVTAKITVTINGSKPIEMLLDSGSELNIITQELQEGLGLPMDPSGANWTLRGVSGHPVHLVGVCRNVPVDVGGMGFHHHFFVTQDKIGEKGMIGGQPWLFNHAARIDYIVGKGLQLQVWKDGDRENPSVRVSIPIIQSQRNVYKTTAQQPREVSISAISLESNELDINQFALRNYGSREATWEPAKPSLIASQGLAPQIPRLGNSLIEAFNTPESDIDKFGPLESNIDYVNKYATLNEPIFEALRQTWITTNVSQPGESLMERIENIGRAKGYEDYEARLFAQSFTHDIMGARYKPVAKKVIPVSTYDPDTVIPEYMPLEPKELPPLTTNPRKMEDIVFTERLTKERIEMIIGNIPNGFLRKAELELILDVIFEFENAFAFMHAERGTFNTKYYPEYTMRTVPHVPWQIKPIRLPKSRESEIMEMLEDQRQAGKYELSSLSYRSAIFAVEKKNGKLCLVHDLQPLNRVTIRDAGLTPHTENDAQFWNYKDDFKDMKLDEIPRFKTPLLHPLLFIWKEGNEWLPPGKLKFACAETFLSLIHHVEPTLTLGEPAIELLSRNILETIERETSPSITDIIYDEYLYRESSNVTTDTPRNSQRLEIFECSMGNYGRIDNYRGRQRSRSADSHEERRRYSRNHSPVRYGKPSPPRREFYREYQSYRPARDNPPYNRYPRRRDNLPIDRSSSPRVRVYEDSTRDDRESSCNTSSKKLPKKETICETSTSTTSTVTDLPSPFVTMSDDHIESLKQISTTLQSTLETTNRVYRAAMDEIPNMETTFALMRNGVQGLATQLVDINKSFRVSGQQLQSRSDALNTAVMTLTEDIDKLRVLARNIRDNDFTTGDYVEVLKSLYPRILQELSKTHNPKGKDMNLLRTHLESASTLIAKLDPNVVPTSKDWTKVFDSVLTHEKEKKATNKQANAKEQKELKEIIATLDNVPDPVGPLEPHTRTITKKTTRKHTGRGIKVVTSDA
jgi:hypothetical protein